MNRSHRGIHQHHRERLAAERGTVIKEPGGRLNVALIYPNTYQVGMANLGLQTVYALINSRSDALCERFFLPDRIEAALYAKSGAPLLSLESSRPLSGFDLILASLSFENDAPNLVAMLAQGGLAPLAQQREGPLVVIGGVAAMLNPEPLAEFADGFLLGEAEVVLAPFLELFTPRRDEERQSLLLHLAQEAEGFYAPAFYRPGYGADGVLTSFTPTAPVPERVKAPKLAAASLGLAASGQTAPGPQFGDMHLMEVGRGCPHACRFCAAGHVYRPPRLGRGEYYLADAKKALAECGKVGLVAAAVSDLPGLDFLAQGVLDAGGGISVSSLRADRLSPELVAALAASGHKTVALAPEAGSDRLRKVINKHLNEEQLFTAIELLIAGGVPNIRLYFMCGLPGEEDGDMEELVRLAKQARSQMVSHSRAKGSLGRLTISVSCFVPKPFTPFQWLAMARQKVLKERLAFIRKSLAKLPNLKVTQDVAKYARLQGVISRGDRRVGRLLAALAGGGKLPSAYGDSGLDPALYLERDRPRDELLPWAFVDHGISMGYLWEEAERARKGLSSPICEPARCRRCGACGA